MVSPLQVGMPWLDPSSKSVSSPSVLIEYILYKAALRTNLSTSHSELTRDNFHSAHSQCVPLRIYDTRSMRVCGMNNKRNKS